MRAVFAAESRKHDPPGFIVSGVRQPSPERPERIDMLLDGLARLGVRPEPPAPISPRRFADGAFRALCPLPADAERRWSRIEGASPVPVPNIHALGSVDLVPAGYPDSVIGQLGFHMGDGSAPVTPETFDAALASAAAALSGAEFLLSGERLVYALCRPPGHHASREVAAGFCYFNNAALAAEQLARAGQRVAILDIDVHHGNGTEAVFYRRADVLTLSIHADPRRFYPFFWGYQEARGEGAGLGFNHNIPLPRGTDDAAYLEALGRALDAVRSFRPKCW